MALTADDARTSDPASESPPARWSWRPSPAALLIVAFLLFITGWVFSNPPGMYSDEGEHYTRALGVAQLDLRGGPGHYGLGYGWTAREVRWMNKATRSFVMPPGLAPDAFYCDIFQPLKTAACLSNIKVPMVPLRRATYEGTYEPFAYFLPGLAADFGHNPTASLLRGRAVSGLVCVLLLALAVLVLWVPRAGPWSLVGLLVGVTPTVLFEASGLSPSGPEICADICVLAAVMSLTRPGGAMRERRLPWVAFTAGGMVLTTAKSDGFAYFGLCLLLMVAMTGGPRPTWRLLRSGGGKAVWTGAGIAVALIAEAWWQIGYQAHTSLLFGDTVGVVRQMYHDLPLLLEQMVASFAWSDVLAHPVDYLVWMVLVVGLVAVAALASPRRGRLLLAGVVVSLLVLTPVIALQTDSIGSPTFGRYTLPFWVALPLLAGELLYRHRGRLGETLPTRLPLYIAVGATAVHLTSWWFNGRRYAVTVVGPLFFPPHAAWSPPLGWYFWMAVYLLAGGAMIAAAARSLGAGQPTQGAPSRVGPYDELATPNGVRNGASESGARERPNGGARLDDPSPQVV